ncbi:CRISPR-associated helicase Cas3' [Geobacillus subterraneus]|uniref:CRISPR-associated helicase Cas3' n=1 Tax=Geobacillus subterraneus TaxID=129338 RepID=UPI002AC918D4|nr:CRISPR-associated helicase Cas3' [Geobacillus subterraneus]WPZ19210.1 CRISPR-associated helicase Cas3' [Geobacillus subterraneus]
MSPFLFGCKFMLANLLIYSTKFQNKLLRKLGWKSLLNDPLPYVHEVHHGYLSPAFLPLDDLELPSEHLKVLCQSIYYHHDRPKEEFAIIEKVVHQDLKCYYKRFSYDKIGPLTLQTKYSKYVRKRIEPDQKDTFYLYIMTKGLLNKIDYAASAGINVEIRNEDLSEKTKGYIATKGELNDLQQYMIEHRDENLVIVASTGVGKTEAALLWIGEQKGFFTLPLKVSINAIYDRIEKGLGFQHVGLLHSDAPSEYMKRAGEGEFEFMKLEEVRQLCNPLTICTLDQLIDFIMRYPGFEMKLATLAYSKLVVDEIQMYSPRFVGYLLIALKQLTELGGKFSIVTATFPPVFEYLMKKLDIPYKRAPRCFLKNDHEGRVMKRHRLKVIHDNLSVVDIMHMHKNKKVLVIVNTVRKAQEVYKKLKEQLPNEKIYLLHSRFIARDRAEKEADILKMGHVESDEKGIWVTTQIVEASLDIDFDILFTELSEVCGLLQRMGRVYRNRHLDTDDANVYVYTGRPYTSGIDPIDDRKSVADFTLFELSKQALYRYDGQVLDEEKKVQLVEEVYDYEVLSHSSYYHQIRDTIHKYENVPPFEVKKGNIDLREIDNEMMIPLSVYEMHAQEIDLCSERLKNQPNMKERLSIYNELKQYTVAIKRDRIRQAQRKGWIFRYIRIDNVHYVPVIDYPYDSEIGLTFR